MRSTAAESLHDAGDSQLRELANLTARLADEIGVLRQAIDDLREELSYELRKLRDEVTQSPPPYRLTSMPRDPCAIDFHERVNAIDATAAAEATIIGKPSESAETLLQALMADAAVEQLTADEWEEDQEFPPGMVVAIDPAIFDWFAEYLPTVREGSDWFVADDGLGNFFLLWRRAEECLLRLLTGEEQAAFSRLTGIVPELEVADEVEVLPMPETQDGPHTAQQQTLW